jgi:signal transduction histidine kinase/CheY-like chemotaxis protein
MAADMRILRRPDITRLRILTVVGLVTLGALLVRLALFDFAAGDSLFHPHGYCYLWQPGLVAAHVISDGLIGLAYIAISLTLIYLVRRARRHLPFSWVFVAFGGFIIACGATHLMEVWTLWSPMFWLSADLKIITAVASVTTAIVLPPLVPKVLAVIQEAGVSDQRRQALERAHAELERRVEERTAELRTALQRAEEANRAKESFLAMVSHELRTPLNAILGWSQMLQGARDDAALVDRGLEVIDRNARVQAQLVEDLLDVSRVGAGTLRLEVEPVDLVRAVHQAVEVVRPAADAREVSVVVEADPPSLPMLADPRRLQQIAWNLLSNAVKFTPAGGRVEVRLWRRDRLAVLRVTDTGIGIEPGFLPRVFDAFSQQDESTTRTHQGLGLGLSITRHLVALHGGTIEARSEGPGTGASFEVRLPLTAAPEAAAEPDPPRAIRLDGVVVLVVDDEPDARETFTAILERAGASVIAMASVDEAIGFVEGTSTPVDLLVSDLAMPGRDGFELVRRLRQSARADRRRLPAVAVSAYARDQDRVAAIDAGFQNHLAKPVTPAHLVQAVAAAVGR